MDIRAAAEAAPDELLRYVVENWHSESVIAHDESIFPAQLPGFIAVAGDRIVGHVSRIVGGRCEITSMPQLALRPGPERDYSRPRSMPCVRRAVTPYG